MNETIILSNNDSVIWKKGHKVTINGIYIGSLSGTVEQVDLPGLTLYGTLNQICGPFVFNIESDFTLTGLQGGLVLTGVNIEWLG